MAAKKKFPLIKEVPPKGSSMKEKQKFYQERLDYVEDLNFNFDFEDNLISAISLYEDAKGTILEFASSFKQDLNAFKKQLDKVGMLFEYYEAKLQDLDDAVWEAERESKQHAKIKIITNSIKGKQTPEEIILALMTAGYLN